MRCALALLALTLPPAGALAEAVDFHVLPKVLAGPKDRPRITVSANDDADEVAIRLQRDDGKSFSYRTGRLRAGQTRTFKLEVAPGREQRFTGSMSVRVGPETRTAGLDFAAEIVTPARITIDKGRVDLARRLLIVQSSRKTARITVEVTGDDGESLGSSEASYEDAAPGTPLEVAWNQGEGTVMRIAVKVHDPDGFYSGVELHPWRIDIPHDEVNFATGSSAIEPSEEPKLAASLEQLDQAVRRYGRFAQIKLFVGGHTDTVGPAAANRALSLDRARAISAHLRRKGLRIPVFYEGFGEESLAVATPDETDEARNRRAEYIVAIEPPSITGGAEHWRPLR